MAEIVMPRLSDSMEEGTVLRWLKGVGDEVAVGDELVEIETDKANMVYESDLDGTVVEILAQEGDTLPVGDTIARVGDASEVVSGGNGGAPREEPAEPSSRAAASPKRRRRPRPRRTAHSQPRLGATDASRPLRSPSGSLATGGSICRGWPDLGLVDESSRLTSSGHSLLASPHPLLRRLRPRHPLPPPLPLPPGRLRA